MKDLLLTFIEFPRVLDQVRPQSCYGQRHRDGLFLFTNREDLDREFDLLERIVGFLKDFPGESDQIEFHLKRLPQLEPPGKTGADQFLLFSIKVFLFHYRRALGLLTEELREALGIRFFSEKLLDLLSMGGEGESFSIKDEYHPKLPEVREKIRETDSRLKEIYKERTLEVKREAGLDFSAREVLTIPRERAEGLPKGLVHFFPFDAGRVTVRMVLPEESFSIESLRDKLILEEKNLEGQVVKRLGKAASEESAALEEYRKGAARIDWLFAKARVSEKWKCRRPMLKDFGGEIVIREGRFLPLEEDCIRDLRPYTPVNCRFDKKINLIRGSNMGGKTVFLKTLLSLQFMAQAGFFVPAEDFSTVIFSHLRAVVKGEEERSRGLSGFGSEMVRFVEACATLSEPSLYIMDEFANTTGSAEGEALLSAIVSEFEKNRVYLFLSTHFVHLPVSDRVGCFRMKGFNEERFRGLVEKGSGEKPIELINQCMDYSLVKEEKGGSLSDALAVARLLGVDRRIIEEAGLRLKGKTEGDGNE